MNKNLKNWRTAVAMIAVILSLIALPVTSAFADNQPAKPVPPGDTPYGMSYADWAAKWWQWEFSIPTSQNPWFDTGANAGVGQSGPVYFLTGVISGNTTVERSISVPLGKAFFFPILNSWCDNVDVNPPVSYANLQSCAASVVDGVSELHVTVDGKKIDKLYNYRVKTAPFCDWFPATDNVYQTQFGSTFSGWTCPVAADGYWLMLAPLPAGNHTIVFGGTSGTFSLNVTYHVNVIAWSPK